MKDELKLIIVLPDKGMKRVLLEVDQRMVVTPIIGALVVVYAGLSTNP